MMILLVVLLVVLVNAVVVLLTPVPLLVEVEMMEFVVFVPLFATLTEVAE
jgi:hypothetical protein